MGSPVGARDTQSILVTGAAGFIGFHLAQRLLSEGCRVVGIDDLNAYYDVRLKEARLERLRALPGFEFIRLDIADRDGLQRVFREYPFAKVFHLAAQAGVRYSLQHPEAYVNSNLVGFANVLEACRQAAVQHLVFASSSSVYGANGKRPFSVHDRVDYPLNFYAATKRANELMAHSYAHLYRLPCTGLRFFTVYGPWGRPDMALFHFTKSIVAGEPIQIFNHGQMERDFTYIDDIIEGVVRVGQQIPQGNATAALADVLPVVREAPLQIYNIGRHEPFNLLKFVEVLEAALGVTAQKEFLPMQPGDVPATYAEVADLEAAIGFMPQVTVQEGVRRFVEWYRGYYAQQPANS